MNATLAAMKDTLRAELVNRDMTTADLMRTMKVSRTTADRIVSDSHNSTLDQMDAAFWALGMDNAITETALASKR